MGSLRLPSGPLSSGRTCTLHRRPPAQGPLLLLRLLRSCALPHPKPLLLPPPCSHASCGAVLVRTYEYESERVCDSRMSVFLKSIEAAHSAEGQGFAGGVGGRGWAASWVGVWGMEEQGVWGGGAG